MSKKLRAFSEGEKGNCLIAILVILGIIFVLILVFACCAGVSKHAENPSMHAPVGIPA